ncbi:hypothetical protein [Halorhabdus salina]|uniref:hypothetical protein n=1 Tax=Halorhabdus salina TaxID=2750670 RepID=UPI0015EF7BFB|nr:hypothetical protein [Halorhabdus salina]
MASDGRDVQEYISGLSSGDGAFDVGDSIPAPKLVKLGIAIVVGFIMAVFYGAVSIVRQLGVGAAEAVAGIGEFGVSLATVLISPEKDVEAAWITAGSQLDGRLAFIVALVFVFVIAWVFSMVVSRYV